MVIRFCLIIVVIPLQACSNTLIGEKLENSFDSSGEPVMSNIANVKVKPEKSKEIKSTKKIDKKGNEDSLGKLTKENLITNKDRYNQKITKPIKKVIFNPQPYRIILKLSGANPSAPAESVTKALRKAGVQFEVEKIERFDGERLLKNTSMKRKEL